MKYITSIHAYDCLGSVVYACRVREYKDYDDDPSEETVIIAGSFPGEGIDNPRKWVQELLLHLIEDI